MLIMLTTTLMPWIMTQRNKMLTTITIIEYYMKGDKGEILITNCYNRDDKDEVRHDEERRKNGELVKLYIL